MKTILITVPDYYPKRSGVPHVTKYLAEGLAQRGYCVKVATGSVIASPNFEIINKVEVYRFNVSASTYRKPKGEVRQYIEWFQNQDVDIVINSCKPIWSTTLILDKLEKKENVIKILHSHGASGLYYDNFLEIKTDLKHTFGISFRFIASRYFFNYYFPKYLKKYDRVLCLSKSCGREFGYFNRYINESKIIELGNAADDLFFDDNKKNRIEHYVGIDIDNYCICVANFTEIKNHKLLLQEFYKADISHDLVLIGKDFSMLQYLKKLKKKLDLKYSKKNVYFLDNVERKDIPGILDGAILYICASKWEGYSVSLIEAMARRVPFVSTDVGNARALPGGITVQENELHTAIKSVVTNNLLRERLAKVGHEYAINNCRTENKVNELVNVIESLS